MKKFAFAIAAALLAAFGADAQCTGLNANLTGRAVVQGFNLARPHLPARVAGAAVSAFDAALANRAARVETRTAARAEQAQARALAHAAKGAGCTGGGFTTQTVNTTTTKTVTKTLAPAVKSTGCTGGGVTFGKAALAVVDADPTPAEAMKAVGLGNRHPLLSLELRHAINKQERAGKMTSLEAEAAKSILRNPRKKAALLGQIDAHMTKTTTNATPQMLAGEHPFLDWFVSNWPAILQMIKDIVAAFAAFDNSQQMPEPGALPMPRGPAPQAVYPPVALAC